jgi:hypothetical protein
MAEQHTILGGKVHLYKRPNSSSWQCSSYLAGRNRRVTTKEESLSKAKDFAEDWYLQLRGKLRTGELKTEKTFREAAEQYLREYDIITQGQRSEVYLRVSTLVQVGIWYRSSDACSCRKSRPARYRTIASTASKRLWRTAASLRHTTRCTNRS